MIFVRGDIEEVIRTYFDSTIFTHSITQLNIRQIFRRVGLALAAIDHSVCPVPMHRVIHSDSAVRISG